VRASMQKSIDDNVSPEQRLHTDRWMGTKQTADEQHEEEKVSGQNEPSVSPVPPRFTDYYFFATSQSTEESNQSNVAEMSVEGDV
jgi:hypothetical protein